MRRFAMFGRRGCVAIHLVESKTRGVICLLQEIEPEDSFLPNTVACVFQRGLAKGFDVFRLHVQVNDEDEHK